MNGISRVFSALIIGSLVSFSSADQTTASINLTVISYNILHGTNQQNEDALTSQAAAIAAERPNLVGLQEVDNRCARSGKVDQMKELARLTGLSAAFGAHIPYQGGEYGLGLLSRYPLTDIRTDRISLVNKDGTTETRALLSATATVDEGTTVRLATVHMALNQESRLMQAKEIVKYLRPDDQTVVLTGDFNAEPGSPEIQLLEKSFRMLNDPRVHTFPVGKPVKTIDYIMISRGARVKSTGSAVRIDVPHSDHYPVTATVELKTRNAVVP